VAQTKVLDIVRLLLDMGLPHIAIIPSASPVDQRSLAVGIFGIFEDMGAKQVDLLDIREHLDSVKHLHPGEP